MTEYNPENHHTDYNRQSNGEYNDSQPTYGYAQNQSQGYGYQNYGQPGPYPASFNQPYPGYKPRPHVGFKQAMRNYFKYMFHFSGRASRSEFWWVALFWFLIYAVLTVIAFVSLLLFISSASQAADSATPLEVTESEAWLFASWSIVYIGLMVLGLVQFVTTLGLHWRRVQDTGLHGSLSLINLVLPAMLVFGFMPSSSNGAQYDSPKDVDRP